MSYTPKNETELETLLKNNKYVFLKWGASFCGPCRTIQPYFEKLAAEHAHQAVFYKLEIDDPQFEDRANEQGITSIPFFQLFIDNKLEKSMIGGNPEKLHKFVNIFLNE